jgi:hypothetical protein
VFVRLQLLFSFGKTIQYCSKLCISVILSWKTASYHYYAFFKTASRELLITCQYGGWFVLFVFCPATRKAKSRLRSQIAGPRSENTLLRCQSKKWVVFNWNVHNINLNPQNIHELYRAHRIALQSESPIVCVVIIFLSLILLKGNSNYQKFQNLVVLWKHYSYDVMPCIYGLFCTHLYVFNQN